MKPLRDGAVPEDPFERGGETGGKIQVKSLTQSHICRLLLISREGHLGRLFLDIFPHAKPTRVGKTLSFFKNSLSLSWNSLSFLKICLSLVKKMSFGAIFLENFHTKLKKLRKNWLLVGKFLSFLTNLLEFLGKIA